MPTKDSSFRVSFMGTCNSKVVYQKWVFYKYCKRLLVENKKITLRYSWTTNQRNIY